MPASDPIVQLKRPAGNKPQLFLSIGRAIYLSALALWSSILYFSIVRKSFSHEAYIQAVKKLIFIDFSKFYISGLMAWSSDKSKLYDFAEQMIWVKNILGPLERPADSIPYTPMFCVFMGIFTWLPVEKALLLGFFSIFALAVLSVTALLVQRGNCNKLECVIFWILTLSQFGVTEIFQLGQSSFFWLAMMSAFYLFFFKKNDILSGIALAFLAFKPQYALFATAAPIACKRWKLLAIAALAETIFVLISTSVVGVDTMVSYPKFLNWCAAHTSTIIPNHNPTLGMITLRGLLAPLLLDTLNYQITSMINLLIWIPLFFIWQKCEKTGAEALSWATALTVTCTIFFSVHSMIYDFVLVTIGWAVTLKSGNLSGRIALDDKLSRLWIALFWLIPGFTWLLATLHTSYDNTARTHAIILFCIICIVCVRLRRFFKQAARATTT